MPAAAVIPALKVYTNIVAIKKLVVEQLKYSILNGPIGLKKVELF